MLIADVNTELLMSTFCLLKQENKSHYRTMTKTRTYMKDGVVVTTITSKVVAVGEDNKMKEEHNLR